MTHKLFNICALLMSIVLVVTIWNMRLSVPVSPITPKIYARAVYSCASLGGLTVVVAQKVDENTADVQAVCTVGSTVSFRMRYDGTDKEAKQ